MFREIFQFGVSIGIFQQDQLVGCKINNNPEIWRAALFNNIILEQEQKELLTILVESSRNLSKDKRQKFYVIPPSFSETHAVLIHPGLPKENFTAYPGDIDVLAMYGLLIISYEQGDQAFDVLPKGYAYYGNLKQQTQQPVKNIVDDIKSYIDSNNFQKKYPEAYREWFDASTILWKADSEKLQTTIGHHCREAIQEFASTLVSQHNPPDVDQNKAHDINRIKAVLTHHGSHLGNTEKDFLVALLEYWKTISALIQRQEHGGQREKENLVWEDGRRIVFQTVIVMYEVDRALSRIT